MQPLPQPSRAAVLIASPRVYHDEPRVTYISDLLKQRGITLAEHYPVAALDGKPSLAQHWQEAGVDLVIAAGGDGSIGGAATHVAHSGLPLGILPLGTSNDFARSLRLPLDLETACQTIAEGQTLAIDLGVAQPAASAPYALHNRDEHHTAPPVADHPLAFFTHALTLGLNVSFARLATNSNLRQIFGSLTYPVAALGTLGTFAPMDFTLTFHSPACPLERKDLCRDEIEPDCPYHYQAYQVAVVNAPVFGGPMEISLAGVALDDHLLDILIVERFDTLQLVGAAFTTLMPPNQGRREAQSGLFPGVHHLKAHAITIETAAPADVTLDGELRGRTPIHVASAAGALRVMVPAAYHMPEVQAESYGIFSGR